MATSLLGWLSFGGSLVSVWLYGRRNPVLGPIAGMVTALLFIAFGLTSGVYAAALSNVVFLVIHHQNYLKGKKVNWPTIKRQVSEGFRAVQDHAHRLSAEAGWWDGIETSEQFSAMVPTKLCLIHSEVSEAMEGHRKNLPDDHLPHYSMFAVELADAVIRIGDLAGKAGIDLGPIIAEKMEYNSVRPDHKRENRAREGGKAY